MTKTGFMLNAKKRTYIGLFGRNVFECLGLILWSLIRGAKILVITPPAPPINILEHIFIIYRYIKKSIKEYEAVLGRYKGLWYEMNKEAIDLTLKFYNEEIKGKNKVIFYYNRLLNTNKFEPFIKKEISNDIFSLLRDLHRIRLLHLDDMEILVNRNPVNKFVIEYMEKRYGIKYRTKWVYPVWRPFLLFVYYGWLFAECIRRGVVVNRARKNYKISREAASGFYRKTLRDDMIIDNNKFRIKDMLMLGFDNKSYKRLRAFKGAEERGFDTVSVPKLKININKNIFDILSFYFLIPLKAYFQLLLSTQMYFFYYIFSFHKKCFPIEMLMNLYRIKCYISIKEWGDVEETIILNKYGTTNVIFNRSDLTFYKSCNLAFIAHNIYFVWGDIHYDYHSTNYFVDKKINIGCIFKREYNKAVENKERIINQTPNFKNRKKIVAFFDTSFDNAIHFTEDFFLEYLEIINEFCKGNRDINVLLKPKDAMSYESKISFGNRVRFKKIWDELINCNNFTYLEPLKWSFEEAIAISDVCVSMGLNSPSSVALICGKDALYFDNTANTYHPFAKKYMNKIVFEDKNLLVRQIDSILSGRLNCKDVINQREIREYDAFDDDNALERLRDSLYELTF